VIISALLVCIVEASEATVLIFTRQSSVAKKVLRLAFSLFTCLPLCVASLLVSRNSLLKGKFCVSFPFKIAIYDTYLNMLPIFKTIILINTLHETDPNFNFLYPGELDS
jgi:hypothetical protein